MSSLFGEKTIETIKRIKKTFLWTAVFILIGEVIVGAVLIVAQSFDLIIGRFMATFALCAVVLFVGVNNFSRMEKEDKLVQGFALVSLITNLIWLLIAILMIWELTAFLETAQVRSAYSSRMYTTTIGLTAMAKIMIIALDVAAACFWISNVWSIKETVKPVRPLKITALVCELYCGIYAVVVTLGDFQNAADARWYMLAGLAGFAFVVMACAAVIVSRSGEKKSEGMMTMNDVGNNAEMQAKIQEMVEKEIQARMAAQGVSAPQAAQNTNIPQAVQSTNAPQAAQSTNVPQTTQDASATQITQNTNVPQSTGMAQQQ